MDLLAIAVAAFVQYAPAEALTMIVCTRPEPIAEHVATAPRRLAGEPGCSVIPPTRIYQPTIYAGPLKDWAGDDYYIAEHGGFYFPVWPKDFPDSAPKRGI